MNEIQMMGETSFPPFNNLQLKEPDGFLDSIPDFHFDTTATSSTLLPEPHAFSDSISGIPTHPTANSTANLRGFRAMEISVAPTEGAAAADVTAAPLTASTDATSNFFQCPACCRHRLSHNSLWRWGQRRRRRRRRLPSYLVGSSTANAAPLYLRVFSNVQSIGSSVYSSLRSIGSSLHSSQGSSNHRIPRRPPSSFDIYESKLRRARWAARTVGSFYNLSTFLTLCSLTWATVALLGAFVSNLRFVDYAMVTSLLLLEAIRLASAAFFTILLTRGLARRSQDPRNIIHGRDDHYRRALAARIVSSILQTVLILPSAICPIIRFPNLQYKEPQNLNVSLFIFYIFIIINAGVSSVTLVCTLASFLHLRDRYDQSILRFYDELLMRAISFGVIRADEFGFVQFAYRMLGSEYARIIQPEAVVKNHRKLIEYLYRHRLGQDFLAIFMDEDDGFIQQAAVNMVGFWADPSKKVGLEEVKLTKKVLSKMADKVDAGQVGWAATNSFGGVARMDPSILARTEASDGTPLLDRLAELVEGRSSGSLIYVRTLALFYHYSYEKGQDVPMVKQERELVEKLKQLLKGTRVHRARLFAAYLLYLMRHLDESCYDAVFAIRPTNDAYWFQMELDLLHFIRRKCMNGDVVQVPEDFIRPDDNVCSQGRKYL